MFNLSRISMQFVAFFALSLLLVGGLAASDASQTKATSIALPALPNFAMDEAGETRATANSTGPTSLKTTKKSPAQGLDVVLVMDSSGSMKKNDPNDLRKPAAKLFLSLLGKDDRISIVSFSDQGYPVAYLTHTQTHDDQKILFTAIDKVSNKGGYTNITGGLHAAKRVFDQAWDAQRKHVVVLMSDGRMDLASTAQDKQATSDLITKLLPEMTNMGIEVHTIAFTESSDMRLLQSIANQSNGHFNMARSDRELHNVFASIFEQSKEPDILPMYGERFLVDSNVREITIVANKERLDTQISFTTPSGQQITEQNRPADIRWLVSDQFDLITMQNPQPGEWQMLPVGDKNRAYIITDLEMQLQLTPEKPQPGDVVSVDVWLEEDGQQLNRQEILAALRVSLVEQFPDGTVERFALLSSRTSDNYLSGYYHAKLHLNDYGRYRVEVSASTGTFDRVKSKIIDIQQVMAPDQLLAALEDPHSQAIQPIVAVEPPRAMPSVRPQEQVTPPKLAPQPEPATQEPEERPAKTPVPVEITEPEEEGGFLIGLLIFFLFNLILVGGGAAVWWLKRRVEAEPKS